MILRRRRPVLIAALLLAGGTSASTAQTVGVAPPASLRSRPVRDSALLNVVVNARLLAERDVERETGLIVRVSEVAGASGSAKTGESDAVVHWLYVAVSEMGELVEQRAYRVGPFYDPKVERIVAEGRIPVVYIAYGAPTARRHARIEVDLQGMRIGTQRP